MVNLSFYGSMNVLVDHNSAGLVAPIWTKPENDDKYRAWARELAAKFRDELDRTGLPHGESLEGGAQVRGPKGAVILYGNYDRECPLSSYP